MIIYILGKMLGVEGVVLFDPRAGLAHILGKKRFFFFDREALYLCVIYLIFGRKRPKCTRI